MQSVSLPMTARLLKVLFLSSFASIALLTIRAVAAGNLKFWFLGWNLVLAWLPLLFAVGLWLNLPKKGWLHWQNIVLSILWLGFLPNSYYLMSDLIHLQSSGETSILYDIAMMMSFVINGLILGTISAFIVHIQLLKRLKPRQAHTVMALVFLACGFAIYLGRYLRWNTWDIVVNPAGLLFDLSERVINPIDNLQTFIVTFVFFVIIGGLYMVVWELIRLLESFKA